MRIVFGRHFDGLQPQRPQSVTGSATLGPAGLLAVLENQLGLPPPTAHPSEFAFRYLQCLRDASSPERFFHRSLQVDPVNVARSLLAWREQWFEAGWNGTFPEDVPKRLADMAAVEDLAKRSVPLGIGERLQRVAAVLSVRRTQIESIELHTELDEFPPAWQTVLAELPYELAPGLYPAPAGPHGSDLALVQSELLALAAGRENKNATRTPLHGDGSLAVLKSASRDLSADTVAEYLLAYGTSAETLLVAEQDGIILDNALERVGLPRSGFQYHTPFRGATQVLKLSLALMWAPVDPHRMLQFLLHPVGPIPRWVRSRLADAVATSPGVGGPAWKEALDSLEQTLRNRLEGKDAEVTRLLADVAYWLNGERYDPGSGAPLDALIDHTQRVSTWASAQLRSSESLPGTTLYAAAFAQAEALLAGLAAWLDSGVERIARLEFERLVDEVSTEAPDPSSFSEAGHARATVSPGAATSPWPTVIWWNLSPPSPAVAYPWSRFELDALRASGVHLPSTDERLRIRTRHWLRPICSATNRLVLAVHDDDRGTHPVWTQIEQRFNGLMTVHVEQRLLRGELTLAPLTVPARPLPLHPLPAPRRWWSLSGCAVAPRDVESYSSLSKLCDYPHEWILTYAARLRVGRAADVSDGALLFGNLGHRLIEEFFRAHGAWRAMPDHDVIAWVRTTWPGMVEQEGAVLLEPGRGVDRQRVGAILERALVRLLDCLRSAEIQQVAAEALGEASFGNRRLTGSIDLLLTDGEGRRSVIDVKWSRQSLRSKLLVENRALQLATYAYLQKTLDASEAWPPGAFFILSRGNLLAAEGLRFPGAIVSASRDGEGLAELWRRLTVTCGWRWQQLKAGRVEVVTSLTEPDGDSSPPDGALAPVTGGDPFDEFANLTGWEANR